MRQKDLKAKANKIYCEPGIGIRGERVVTQFRKMHRPHLVKGTSPHRIQETKLEGSVLCIIEKPLRYVRDKGKGKGSGSHS